MSKLNIVPAIVFAPFKSAMGVTWDKVCNDASSMFGRWEKDFLKSTSGEWKVTSTGKLKSKEGHEIQMPLNNPMSILVRFGMQLNDVAANMGQLELNEDKTKVIKLGIESRLPKQCIDWIEQQRADIKQGNTPKPEDKPEGKTEDNKTEDKKTEPVKA